MVTVPSFMSTGFMIFLILLLGPVIINSVLVKLGVSLFAKSREFMKSRSLLTKNLSSSKVSQVVMFVSSASILVLE